METRLLAEDPEIRRRVAQAGATSLELWKPPHCGWPMLEEECAELVVALHHLLRDRGTTAHLAEELADVFMCIHQVNHLLPEGLLDAWILKKLERHEKRIVERRLSLLGADALLNSPAFDEMAEPPVKEIIARLTARIDALERERATPSDDELHTMFRVLPEGINATEFRRLVYERCVADAELRRR